MSGVVVVLSLLSVMVGGCAQKTLVPVRQLGEVREPVVAVAWGEDGRLVATGSEGGVVQVWDVERGGEVARVGGYRPSGMPITATDLAFSPDGQRVAFGGEGGAVRVWDVKGGGVRELVGHSRRVAAVAFSRDGKRLASASGGDGYFDASGAATAPSTRPTTRGGPDYWRAPFGMEPMEVIVFDVETGGVVSRIDAAGFTHVVFSPDVERFAGPRVAVTARTKWPVRPGSPEMRNGNLEVWETASGRVVRVMPVASAWVAFSPDGRRVLNGGVVTDVETGRVVCDTKDLNVKLFMPDGRSVMGISQGIGGSWRHVWETPTWVRPIYVDLRRCAHRETGRYYFEESAKAGAFAAFMGPQWYSPDRRYVIDQKLRLWEVPR